MRATRPVALATGAFSGIGKAAAVALADAGFPGDRNEPQRLSCHR